MISVTLKQNVIASPSQVCTILLEHEQLNRFFDADFSLIKNQNNGEIKGGKGAIRQISMIGVKFEEEIMSADKQHIHYKIVGDKPVSDHRGDIYFSLNKITTISTTDVTYQISCKAPWWLPSFVLSFLIKKDVTQALKKIARYFKGETL
jgi:hypothetical protein